MSAPVQGPEPVRVGLSASQRRFVRVLALAAMLLVAAFAAAPARAQDAAVVVPAPEAAAPDPATTDSSPAPTVPTDPGPPAAPAESPATDASPDPVVTDDPGAGDTVVETPQSTPDADRTPTRQPSHNADGGGGQTASAAPTVPTTGEDTVDTVAPSSDGYPGAWSGQDTFVVDKAKGPDSGAAGAFGGPRGPFSGLIAFRAASHASGVVATARRSHSVAQVSALGGPPGSGHQPGHNLFLNLLSGPGGSAAGLAFASILAILGVAFVLPRDRLRTFRMPAVSWRPLAYVPPIELPG